MPKRGQHHNDHRDSDVSRGHNNPEKSTPITTGNYKTPETFEEQKATHQPTDKQAQDAKNEWRQDTHEPSPYQREVAERKQRERRAAGEHKPMEGFEDDLHGDFMGGANYGMRGPHEENAGLTASDIKEAVNLLRDISGAELDQIVVLPLGASLEEGATYLDLAHRERGEFVAFGGMLAEAEHYYVPKTAVDYETWNRLRGVHDPRRLNEGELGRESRGDEVSRAN
jgi:hypothetical protein